MANKTGTDNDSFQMLRTVASRENRSQVKMNHSLCFNEYDVLKAYGGAEVYFLKLLTSAVDETQIKAVL